MKINENQYDSVEELLIDPEPKIPPGINYCKLSYWETRMMFRKSAKLILWFIIADGKFVGVKIPSYYNAERLIGKHGKKGKFKSNKRSRFAREFCSVIEGRNINIGKIRFDRLPVSKLGTVKASVRTLSELEGKKLPLAVNYSVIGEIMPL